MAQRPDAPNKSAGSNSFVAGSGRKSPSGVLSAPPGQRSQLLFLATRAARTRPA